ncbi:hypothetical protein DPMN_026725 [Dreissena polymorpha]|uniref:Uncharacterized protein n=1 Tax=Dreissena polymorpha TaxID=45954 RepID=A0A9D4RDT0_DREPO|nr:hypothetical protein DPMN_026725 [Dreissena polymorpha]
MGESRHPCRTPTRVPKKSPCRPLRITVLLEFPSSYCMACISPSSMLNPFITCHGPSCHTRLKVFLK